MSAPDNVRPGQQWFVTVTVYGASGSVNVALSLSAGDTVVTRATATLGSPGVLLLCLNVYDKKVFNNMELAYIAFKLLVHSKYDLR